MKGCCIPHEFTAAKVLWQWRRKTAGYPEAAVAPCPMSRVIRSHTKGFLFPLFLLFILVFSIVFHYPRKIETALGFSQVTPLFHLFPMALSCLQQEQILLPAHSGRWVLIHPCPPETLLALHISLGILGLSRVEWAAKEPFGLSMATDTQIIGKKLLSPGYLSRIELKRSKCPCSHGGN